MVISILLKTTFSPISIHSQLLVKILCQSDEEKKTFKAIEKYRYGLWKLYRNILKKSFHRIASIHFCYLEQENFVLNKN